MRLANASMVRVADGEATGTIEARRRCRRCFGRATAEQVVEHIEEWMTAPGQRGFRARHGWRGCSPGRCRNG